MTKSMRLIARENLSVQHHRTWLTLQISLGLCFLVGGVMMILASLIPGWPNEHYSFNGLFGWTGLLATIVGIVLIPRFRRWLVKNFTEQPPTGKGRW